VRDCFLIHYIHKGKGFYKTGGKVHAINQSSAFCIFPRDVVWYYTDSADPWSFYWFAFNGRLAAKLLERAGITRENPVLALKEENAVPKLMDALHAEFEDENPDDLALIGHLCFLLSELEKSRLVPNPRQSGKKSSGYIEKALNYIHVNYHKDVPVSALADYVGLERSYFSKLFNQTAGYSPQAYILRYRLEKARELLKTTGLSVGEISECTGFSDGFYFSRAFKNFTGLSPAAYRKQ
jgi:AraC-like DNA-binding protein